MKLIAFAEKYSTRYFDASTPEILDKVCRQILQERLDTGDYDPEDEPEYPDDSLSEEEIQKLPAKYQNLENEKLANYRLRLEEYNESKRFIEAVKKCLSCSSVFYKGGPESYFLIQERSYSDYEGFEIIEPEELENN